MEGYHKSVLCREAIDALIPATGGVNIRDAWYLDATLGDGGHSIEILKAGGKVVGIDVDPQALERVQRRFADLEIGKDKYRLIQGNFRDAKNLVTQTELKDQKFAGAIFDLGVSSLQLMDPERGFSFSKKGPLDMRMDPTLQVRALDLINVLSGKELYELFKTLGEEKYSWQLANAFVRAREVGSREQSIGISNTIELARLAGRVVGRRKDRIHPATRVFQALRIAVNDELGALQEGLDQVVDLIDKNGAICIISFHSLEDRIVKNAFRDWESEGLGMVQTQKPIIPQDEEIAKNPRSRSAKMRVFKII